MQEAAQETEKYQRLEKQLHEMWGCSGDWCSGTAVQHH